MVSLSTGTRWINDGAVGRRLRESATWNTSVSDFTVSTDLGFVGSWVVHFQACHSEAVIELDHFSPLCSSLSLCQLAPGSVRLRELMMSCQKCRMGSVWCLDSKFKTRGGATSSKQDLTGEANWAGRCWARTVGVGKHSNLHEQAWLRSQLPFDDPQKAVITIINARHPSPLSLPSCFICQIRRQDHNAR